MFDLDKYVFENAYVYMLVSMNGSVMVLQYVYGVDMICD
jgi:hypothetical protein